MVIQINLARLGKTWKNKTKLRYYGQTWLFKLNLAILGKTLKNQAKLGY